MRGATFGSNPGWRIVASLLRALLLLSLALGLDEGDAAEHVNFLCNRRSFIS